MSDAPGVADPTPPAGLGSEVVVPPEIGRGGPDRPRLGWTELATVLVVYVAVQLGAGIVLVATAGATPSAPALLAVSGLSAFVAVGVALALRVRSAAALGLRRVPARTVLIAVALGLGIWVVSRVLIVVYISLTGDVTDPQQGLTQFSGGVTAVLVVVLGGLLVPCGEEFLFRGVVYGSLRRYGAAVAGIVSSLLFALAHGLNVVFLAVLVLAALNAVLYERTRSVWPCVVVHATFNLLSFGVLLAAR